MCLVGCFTHGTQAINVIRPAVSRQIRNLEAGFESIPPYNLIEKLFRCRHPEIYMNQATTTLRHFLELVGSDAHKD